jgi:hypothetical protein
MVPGLAFREKMQGSYWRLDAPTEVLPLAVTLDARADVTSLLRDRELSVAGTIDAERLATGRSLEGTLAFRFARDGRFHYRLRFQGDDGAAYEIGGQKEWSPLAPVASLSMLAASLYDGAGAEIGQATLRFSEGGGLWTVLRSVRLAVR